MKIQLKPRKNLEEWHPWFAWYPVVTENRLWVWLYTVERRQVPGASEYEEDTMVYRRPQDPAGIPEQAHA